MEFKIATVCLLIGLSGIATAQGPTAEALRTALHDGGHYAVTVLLDEEGKSRCDYDWLDGQWHPYEVAWHTGQVIYGLLHAYRAEPDSSFLAAAQRAGEWWLTLEIKDHPTLKGYLRATHGDEVGELINFTTIADGTPGLFELSRVTQDSRYADVATQAGEWALEHLFIEQEGLIYDLVDAETGQVWRDKSPFFEGQLNIHQVARPNNEGFFFKDMYRHTGKEQHRAAFLALCNSLVEKQHENGFWMDYHPNNIAKGYIHPRSNTWYAESLLEGYILTGDERYLKAAYRTGKALVKWQQKDGAMYYRNYADGRPPDPSSVCGSAVSFAGILWLRLAAHGYAPEFERPLHKAAHWVVRNRFPVTHPDPNLRGAFLETRHRGNKDGKTLIRLRDIATAFGLRFLSMYYLTQYTD